MTTRGLLPIGQFAQACGLTVIALRHYDATGVLPPATVDPSSGYRYYARDQVPTAQLVRLLRQVDVPVDELPKLLARINAGDDVLPELSASLDRRTASAQAALERQAARQGRAGVSGNQRAALAQ
jgi:DNA-binding transcriptional MerR regulator